MFPICVVGDIADVVFLIHVGILQMLIGILQMLVVGILQMLVVGILQIWWLLIVD